MIDHVSVTVTDLGRSIAFYDAVFGPLGARRLWTAADAAGYGYTGSTETFAIKLAIERVGNVCRDHVAFNAPSREAVIAFHAHAIAFGGTDDGLPGFHAEYGPGYFAAFVGDPDGNRLEAVLHE